MHVNPINEEEPEEGPSLRRFFSEWNPADEGEAGQDSESTVSALNRSAEIAVCDDIVVSHGRHIVWVTTQGGAPQIMFGKRGRHTKECVVKAPASLSDEALITILNDASQQGKTTYLYVGNAALWSRIATLWKQERIGMDRAFTRCSVRGERVAGEERQQELTRAYHEGKTNHRGETETLAALKRAYIWRNMRATVHTIIAGCEVCQKAKYQRRPIRTPLEVTATAERPAEEIQMDTFAWEGRKWVTIVDSFSKVAMAVEIARQTAEETLRALLRWAQVYGTPARLITDGGREFANRQLSEMMKTWGTDLHQTTPGRPQGHGAIERLHSTLTEHLRLIESSSAPKPADAMGRAIVAYNHSVHAATGFTPLEVLCGGGCMRKPAPGSDEVANYISEHLEELRRKRELVREKLTRDKRTRAAKSGEQLREITGRLDIGDTVFRRIPSNRRKLHALYDGPYRVVALRERNIVTVQDLGDPRRRRTCHVDQLKIP